MKRLALLAALLACWAAPALAAPGFVGNLGTATNASAVTSQTLSTTGFDCPVGDTLIAAIASSIGTAFTASDTAGNSWTGSATTGINTATGVQITLLFAPVTNDLPAPCTLTASETSTNLAVTAVGTCASNAVFASGMAISGGSFTGKFNGSCTLTAGANPTCAVTGGATVASATATISSVITFSWTSASKPSIGVACFSGLSSTPFDLAAAGFNNSNSAAATSTPGIATGTLHPNTTNDVVIGVLATSSSHTGYTRGAGFSADMNVPSPGGSSYLEWSYDLTATSTGVTYIPTWTTSRVFIVNAWAFKDAASGGAVVCTRSLLGVGC